MCAMELNRALLTMPLHDQWRRHIYDCIRARREHFKQEFVRPRWPYDMRPSARAEKYMCVIVIRYVARRDAR